MKWFINFKISRKIIYTTVFISILTGIVGAIGIVMLKNNDDVYTDLYNNYGKELNKIGIVNTDFQKTRVALRDMIMNTDSASMQKSADEISLLDESIQNQIEQIEKNAQLKNEKDIFMKLHTNLENYYVVRNNIIDLALSNKKDEALDVMYNDLPPVMNEAVSCLDELVKIKSTNGDQINIDNTKSTNRTIMIIVGVIAFTMLVAISLGFYVSKIISKPLNELVDAANTIAEGNLNVYVQSDSKDETGKLAEAFRKMTNNINEVLNNIRSASEQVAAGSSQTSESATSLSQGVTEQASAIEELTASMEQISAQTKLNANSANEAKSLADKTKDVALHGDSQMSTMLHAMEDINQSSSNISKIIKVIDEIAFQTNILALNAAVEAARAGQQGRGFAVVAEEVRNLAARSANAAKETTDMIESSIKKVEDGTKIAKETAKALHSIVDGVDKVANLINDIAVASNEQELGISQINQGIMQVSQVVQSNSATSEESAAASEELSGQAELLNQQVSRFKLKTTSNSFSYSGEMDEINPDIRNMLDRLSEKQVKKDSSSTKPMKISLGDEEFGKY